MNDNAKKWIEALLSGKYKQGNTLLADHTNQCFCALGVAMEVYLETEKPTRLVRGNKVGYVDRQLFRTYDTRIPLFVAEWLGLSYAIEISSMNDEGHTFKKIVKHLSKHEDKYFQTMA